MVSYVGTNFEKRNQSVPVSGDVTRDPIYHRAQFVGVRQSFLFFNSV